ncbi:MAG: hypothetical protein JWN35_755 [Frankiales bacterium]|jgi:hypothetical protein|nr:hypothetical protein [Frankiales bacterium]
MPRRWNVGVAVALVFLSLSACGIWPGSGSTVRTAQLPDGGVEHVHGLDVDPADGVLYAATHYGLFRIPGQGKPTRVANRMQDTMGFTIVGPKTFLGSGHPDALMEPDLPPRLGLMRSTDAGQSWKSVSLSGQADFHALRRAHGTIYGWDSDTSRLMVSPDNGVTWQLRAILDLADFVVGPDDPRVLFATTERGLLRSSDAGRSFQPSRGPALAVLAWKRPDNLVGLDTGGALYASADGGRSWTKRGSLGGSPEAITTDKNSLYAAVAHKGIFASIDGGRTWTLRYNGSPAAG